MNNDQRNKMIYEKMKIRNEILKTSKIYEISKLIKEFGLSRQRLYQIFHEEEKKHLTSVK